MTKELNGYFKDIESRLHTLPRKKRAAVLREYRDNVAAFLEENPGAAFQEVEAAFGTPSQVEESFLRSEDFQKTEQRLHINKQILRIIRIVIAILVAAILILGTIYVVDTWMYTHGEWVNTSAQEGPPESDTSAIATY